MSAPKSTVKILYQKGQCKVEYEDNIDASQYYIHELTRAALRDVGKFVSKKFREQYYSHFKKHTGDAGRVTKTAVWSSKSTEHPRVEIGIKTGRQDGFYAYFQEFGCSTVPRLSLMQNAVKDNTAEIIKIESQYLSGLEGEWSRLEEEINEADYEEDEDE